MLGLAAAAALGACASAGAITGDSALAGKDLQSATSLYGPWEDHVVLDGVDTYIFRRHYTDAASKTDFYCELRVQMGFRTTISRTQMQGYPAACDLFSIRYESTSGPANQARQQQRVDAQKKREATTPGN